MEQRNREIFSINQNHFWTFFTFDRRAMLDLIRASVHTSARNSEIFSYEKSAMIAFLKAPAAKALKAFN